MVNPNSSLIVAVIDRSGSMGIIRDATISGFNEFLAGQKILPGECKLHMVQFDHEYNVVYNMTPISDVLPLNTSTYVPRGNTALLDAIGRTINDVGNKLSAMNESVRPGRVIFMIQTDGHENASSEFRNRSQIFEMITHQRNKYAWEFIFLGANQDAIGVGASLGVSKGLSMTYTANSVGTANLYASVSRAVTNSRFNQTTLDSFTEEDRLKAIDNADKTTTSPSKP